MDNDPEPTYEELLAKINHPKQRAFLENYPKFKVYKHTAEAIGSAEMTFWHWTERCKDFKEALEALKKRVNQERLQLYEAELDKRALGGVSKQSDILLMFALKAEDPDKYREKVNAIPVSGNIVVELAVPQGPEPKIEVETKEPKQLPAASEKPPEPI